MQLESMSALELDQLLTALMARIKEEQWKAKTKRLEVEAADAVNALREFTGRNYTLMLGTVTVVPTRREQLRRIRLDLAA